jgi:hypothetical protein
VPIESWYSEPLIKFMYSAVGFGVTGRSNDSEVTWFPKAEEGVVQRKGITMFEMCRS